MSVYAPRTVRVEPPRSPKPQDIFHGGNFHRSWSWRAPSRTEGMKMDSLRDGAQEAILRHFPEGVAQDLTNHTRMNEDERVIEG